MQMVNADELKTLDSLTTNNMKEIYKLQEVNL